MSVDDVLSITSLVESDPMTSCLITLDQTSWQALIDLFESFSENAHKEKFMQAAQAIQQDPIIKGKSKPKIVTILT